MKVRETRPSTTPPPPRSPPALPSGLPQPVVPFPRLNPTASGRGGGRVRGSSVTPSLEAAQRQGRNWAALTRRCLCLSRALWEMGTAPTGAVETGHQKCLGLRAPPPLPLPEGGPRPRRPPGPPALRLPNPGSACTAASPTSFPQRRPGRTSVTSLRGLRAELPAERVDYVAVLPPSW